MKTTRVTVLGIIAAVSAVLAWLTNKTLVTSGYPQLTPQLALPIVLVSLAVLVIVLALPVRRRRRGDPKPLNPFYATNVLVLAKSAALTGAVFAGAGAGFLIYSFTQLVVEIDDRTWTTVAAAVFGLLLTIAGLIAERFCRIPPVDDDKNPHGPTAPVPEA